VFAPAGTPREIVVRLNAEINKLLAQPDFRERLAALGAEPAGGDPEKFAAHVRAEGAKWAKVIAEAGVKAE
jgi:tripartite-type tricarboxylate transporter receptor subunit TctC